MWAQISSWPQGLSTRRGSTVCSLDGRSDEGVELRLSLEVLQVPGCRVFRREAAHAHPIPGSLARDVRLDHKRGIALGAKTSGEPVRFGAMLGCRQLKGELAVLAGLFRTALRLGNSVFEARVLGHSSGRN